MTKSEPSSIFDFHLQMNSTWLVFIEVSLAVRFASCSSLIQLLFISCVVRLFQMQSEPQKRTKCICHQLIAFWLFNVPFRMYSVIFVGMARNHVFYNVSCYCWRIQSEQQILNALTIVYTYKLSIIIGSNFLLFEARRLIFSLGGNFVPV